MSEYLIPEDLQALSANCAEQMQNDLPPEMTGIAAEDVYPLIERIAKLEAENASLNSQLRVMQEPVSEQQCKASFAIWNEWLPYATKWEELDESQQARWKDAMIAARARKAEA